VAGNPTFLELLERVRVAAVGAYTHQDLPFDRLVDELQVERRADRQPLVQVVFTMDGAAPAPGLELPGVAVEPLGSRAETAKFDLRVVLARAGGRPACSAAYDAELWEGETVARMLRDYATLLAAFTARPELRVLDVALGGDGQDDGDAYPAAVPADEVDEFDFAF
jgi:non-ribosomal peptide synthetase component F